ncbi:MAG: GPR endopeptidase, partial [Oscillospiraceae bacterium]|nr:GPR endopeptidase [Oscillospiraceae bacterium]
MLGWRTDLALEAKELWEESAKETSRLSGVKATEQTEEGYGVTQVDILNEEGAATLGKPVGRYCTVDLSPFFQNRAEEVPAAVNVLAKLIRDLLPPSGCVFAAGLGNRLMTPDAIGPMAVEHLLVTRHLSDVLPQLRPLCAAAAGVLGTTGLESGEWVQGMAQRAGAETVIVIDALAARSLDRLCSTVQISDTGIIPGSGVGNSRMALNRQSMGVPVVSIGVPTVVDTATLAIDLLGEGASLPPSVEKQGRNLFVTPRDVDAKLSQISKLIGYAV